MRKLLALVGLLVLLPSAYVWWLLYATNDPLEDTRFTPPGSVTVDLDEGTYRIYVEDLLSNAKGCDPEDYADDLDAMGLVLVPEDGGEKVRPERAGSCDGGNNQNGPHPISVSELEVPADGSYVFRGGSQPPMTNNNKETSVYLTEATGRPVLLGVGIAGTLLGGTLLWLAIPRKRGRSGGEG
ncbi:hypothetical protein [Nocardioides stalactiti]|uniref:hypothetical protein n=1 Tax=Nocardioides stalactiti TaxID=2755356 RepID=UPI001602702B|nr:hypothetical protein [Nocardioides stalactiti]